MGAFALLVCFLFLRFSSNQICQVLRLSLTKNSIVLEILQKSKQVQAETKKKKKTLLFLTLGKSTENVL